MAKRFMARVCEKWWQIFISLRLTFVLLAIISLGAVIGMSFDQTLSFDEFYKGRDSQSLSTFFLSFFELYDAFHSWWYSFAVLLLAANLIACSIERLPRIYFDYIRPRPFLTPRRLLGLSLKDKILCDSLPAAQSVVREILACDPFSKSLDKTKQYYFIERHKYARFGVYIVHIALLIIMFSSIYTTQRGVDGHVMIEEGRTARFITAKGAGGVNYTYDLGFNIGCKDFRLRTFIDNSPMEFESDLFIGDYENNILAHKTVRVNEPLSYQGYTFYQSSFRPMISEKVVELSIKGPDDYVVNHRVRLNSPISLPNGEQIYAERLFEDFAGLGQALRLVKKDPQGESTYFHIFRRHKDFDRVVRGEPYSIELIDVDQNYATGLSIGNVPGIEVIFTGFLVLLVGLFMCFFMTPIRFFARISPQNDAFIVDVAAQGYRNPSLVKEVFNSRLISAKAKL